MSRVRQQRSQTGDGPVVFEGTKQSDSLVFEKPHSDVICDDSPLTASIQRHYLGCDVDTYDVWIPLVGLETWQYHDTSHTKHSARHLLQFTHV